MCNQDDTWTLILINTATEKELGREFGPPERLHALIEFYKRHMEWGGKQWEMPTYPEISRDQHVIKAYLSEVRPSWKIT